MEIAFIKFYKDIQKKVVVLYHHADKPKMFENVWMDLSFWCFGESSLLLDVRMMGNGNPGAFSFPKEAKDQEGIFVK